jgi:hypothetical protein
MGVPYVSDVETIRSNPRRINLDGSINTGRTLNQPSFGSFDITLMDDQD